MKRLGSTVLGIALLVGACGGGEMALPDYVDRINEIVGRAVSRGDELFAGSDGAIMAEGAQLSDFTPQDLQIALEMVGVMELEIREAADAIDPPDAAAEFHNLYFDTRFALASEALAARAGNAATWEELSATPEMAAYRAAVGRDKATCIGFQADMDATGGREVFADMAWIPNDLKEVVTALLACDIYPVNPDDLFRP